MYQFSWHRNISPKSYSCNPYHCSFKCLWIFNINIEYHNRILFMEPGRSDHQFNYCYCVSKLLSNNYGKWLLEHSKISLFSTYRYTFSSRGIAYKLLSKFNTSAIKCNRNRYIILVHGTYQWIRKSN